MKTNIVKNNMLFKRVVTLFNSKKIVSSLLVYLFLFISLSVSAFSVSGIEYYKISSTGDEVGVSIDECTSDNLNIPSIVMYDGKKYNVTKIYSSNSSKKISYLSVPVSIKQIDIEEYLSCQNLFIEDSEEELSINTYGDFRCNYLYIGRNLSAPAYVTNDYLLMVNETLEIGQNVSVLNNFKFGNASSFKSCNVSDENPYLKLQNGAIYDKSVKTLKKILPSNKGVFTVPSSVVEIDDCAAYSTEVSAVNLPSKLKKIGKKAFSWSSIEFISIPSSVESIGVSAFRDCYKLKSIMIPEGVIEVGSYAFAGCSVLEEATINNSVVSDYEFYNCKALKSVNICGDIKRLGSCSFLCETTEDYDDCLIEKFNIESIASWCALDIEGWSGYYNPLHHLDKIYHGGKVVTDLVIPEGVDNVKADVFGNVRFQTVDNPSTLKSDNAGISGKKATIYRGTMRVKFSEIENAAFYEEMMSKVDRAKVTSVTISDSKFDKVLTYDQLTSGMNPNCLYYLASDAGWSGKNIIDLTSNTSSSVVLTDGNPFYCPADFTAKKVEFRHNPKLWANGTSGWETICLPFQTKVFSASQSGEIVPVKLGSKGDFWLRKFVSAANDAVQFASTSDGIMKANTPYIIAFPGNGMGEGSLQGQTITFSASDVEITSTTMSKELEDILCFVGNYDAKASNMVGWEIDATGEKFEYNTKVGDKPFAAYLVNYGSEEYSDVLTIELSKSSEEGEQKPGEGSGEGAFEDEDMKPLPDIILVETISLSLADATLNEGEPLQLTATVSPANALNQELNWTSADATICSVTDDGLITALSEGKTTVTASATDGSGVAASCEVTVIKVIVSGDANGDGKFDGDDISSIVDDILSGSQEGIDEEAADVNEDGKIDIGDVTGGYEIIGSGSITKDPDYGSSYSLVYAGNYTVEPGESLTVDVGISGITPFSAYQFDVAIPQGLSLKSSNGKLHVFLSNERTNTIDTDIFQSKMVDSNTMRVICASSTGKLFDGNYGSVANFTIVTDDDTPEGEYEFAISNAKISKAGLVASLDNAEFCVIVERPTGIQTVVNSENNAEVYDLYGRKINRKTLSSGLYIRGGKKVIVR